MSQHWITNAVQSTNDAGSKSVIVDNCTDYIDKAITQNKAVATRSSSTTPTHHNAFHEETLNAPEKRSGNRGCPALSNWIGVYNIMCIFDIETT